MRMDPTVFFLFRIQIRIQPRIQGFDGQKLKKIYSRNFCYDKKLQFTYS